MTPTTLYHGSMYRQTELMPGFKRSGKLVQWDGVENNTYLYATSVKAEAISLGFGSALEKHLGSCRYVTVDEAIVVYFPQRLPEARAVWDLELYVYTIDAKPEHRWVKNNNPLNRIDTEWTTQATIRSLRACEPVDLQQWLADKRVLLTTAAVDTPPLTLLKGKNWGSQVRPLHPAQFA